MFLINTIAYGFILTIAAQSITDVISSNSETSILKSLLNSQPAIGTALNNAQNITVLAPSNAAISNFLNSPEGSAAVAHTDQVANLLTYHVLTQIYTASSFSPTPVFASTLLKNSSYTSLADGQKVKAQVINSDVFITSGLLTQSRVVTPDLHASNGVVHVIDRVLTIPRSITETALAANLTSLASALDKTHLSNTVNELQQATVFSPNNAAFDSVNSKAPDLDSEQLIQILKYHVASQLKYSTDLINDKNLRNLDGEDIQINSEVDNVTVDSATVIIPDILVSNGVVHVIDGVLGVDSHADHSSSQSALSRKARSARLSPTMMEPQI